MLRRAQRNLSPLPSWSVLRLRPREGKGVPEVPPRGAVPLRPRGLAHRLTRHNVKKTPWAAPRETRAPAVAHTVALPCLWVGRGSARGCSCCGPGQCQVRGPVRAPGAGPASTLTATWLGPRDGRGAKGCGGRSLESVAVGDLPHTFLPSQKMSVVRYKGAGRAAPTYSERKTVGQSPALGSSL